MPTVSVIIPCYNQGQFVDEAVNSVLAQSYQDFEIIVVNDGSTDAFTTTLLSRYLKPKTQVITTENRGLAGARNTGISEAKGKYILPLDADDFIEPHYMENAVSVLEQNSEVGIVYGRARLFGAVDAEWALPAYSIEEMLVDNVIYCSAFFQKKDWETVGGYDTEMIYGWEDYDFWLALIELGRKVVKLQEIGFCYRVASDSMVRSKEKWQKAAMFKRIYSKHQPLFSKHIDVWINELLDTRDVYYSSRLYVDCGDGLSDNSSVMRKVEQGTGTISFNLSSYTDIISLRFDPVDNFSVVEINSFSFKYHSGEVKVVTNFQSNALYQQEGKLLFDSRDPQCFFPELSPVALAGLVEVTVSLKFHALAERALVYILEYQKQVIAADTSMTDKIKSSAKSFITSLAGPPK